MNRRNCLFFAGLRECNFSEFILQLQNQPLGGFFPDPRNMNQLLYLALLDRGNQLLKFQPRKDCDGELRADSGNGNQLFEQALLLFRAESVERKSILPDVRINVKSSLRSRVAQFIESGNRNEDAVTYAACID